MSSLAPASHPGKPPQNTTAPLSLSSFQFDTIGKEPELLKRISAPEPNQDYQDDSTPSPSHSPTPEHNKVAGLRPTLFDKLTNGDNSETKVVSHPIGNTPSDLGTSTAKLSSAFDPAFGELFAANTKTSSRPAMKNRLELSSDGHTSPAGNTSNPAQIDLSALQPIGGTPGLTTDDARFTSVELSRLELAYPATEHRLSSQSYDSYRRPSMEADSTADQGFPTQLNNVTTCPESIQSKVLAAIALFEGDFQLIASQTSLALEKANLAETVAEKSLSVAKDAFAVAQQSVVAANIANNRVKNALSTLTHLRQYHTDESAANEHDRADLLCKMAAMKRGMELSSSSSIDAEPAGLGKETLHFLSTETMKLARERDPGAIKRKRSSDDMDQSSVCDLTSRPSKGARYDHPTVFFDKTVELEAEAAREAWTQVERHSTVPPDLEQRAVHEQEKEDTIPRGRKNVVGGDNYGQAACPGLPQSQLVKEDADMLSHKLETQLTEGSEQSGNRGSSHSEERLEASKEMQAQWEREVAEHKLEIARFQMQERLQEKKDKRKGLEKVVTTSNEQATQSTSRRIWPPQAAVSPTTTAANALERNVQPTSQPKSGLTDASRMKEVKTRLAFEKQKASPAIGTSPTLAARTPSQPSVSQVPMSVADTGRLNYQGQGQGDTGRKFDDKVIDQISRCRRTPTTRGSAEATDVSRLSVGNVTARKTLAALQPRGKTSAPQTNMITVNDSGSQNFPIDPPQFEHPPSMLLLNEPLCRPMQSQDQDPRRASLPPIECIADPEQAASTSVINHPPSSRTPPKRKQGIKKTVKPQQIAGNIPGTIAQPSSVGLGPRKKNLACNAQAVSPLALANSNVTPKVEIISPTFPPIDQHFSAQEGQISPSSMRIQPVTASPQQNKNTDSSALTGLPQPSHDGRQASLNSGPRLNSPPKTVEHGSPVEPTNVLQLLPDNGQAVTVVERAAKPLSKTTLTAGQAANTAFLKTPHGGHREISGSAASSKAPLPTNGQQVARDPRAESSASFHSTQAKLANPNLELPAASTNIPTVRDSMPENPPANVASLDSSQAPSFNDHSISASIRESNPLLQPATFQRPTHPKPTHAETRSFHSRSRSPHSHSPPPINSRKRNRNVMEEDHWSPSQETWERPRATRRTPPPTRSRSRSPNRHVSLIKRLSESTNPHPRVSRSISRFRGDSYRPDDSPPHCYDIDKPRNQSKSLLDRFTPNTKDPESHSQGYDEFVPSKKARFLPPRSTPREERGGVLTLQERIS